MTSAATLRTITTDGVVYLAQLDVAALMLDAAAQLEQTPSITAAEALRSITAGLANHERASHHGN